jgi:hypothetical protein
MPKMGPSTRLVVNNVHDLTYRMHTPAYIGEDIFGFTKSLRYFLSDSYVWISLISAPGILLQPCLFCSRLSDLLYSARPGYFAEF